MDRFDVKLINNTCLSIYRSYYAPVDANMFIMMREGEALVIDPNVNEEVDNLFLANKIKKVFLLLTHEHFDHTNGVIWFQQRYDCTLICNRVCAEIVSIKRHNNPMLIALVLAERDKEDGGNRYAEFKKNFKPYSLFADIIYDTPCEFHLLGMTFKCTQTPGHSPGSWCLVVDDSIVITGDTLIKDTPIIIRFIESREQDFKTISLPYLKSLDSNLYVLPGHFDPFVLKDNNILHTYV